MSLRNIFIKIPVGVTTAKKIINIIIGEINFPKNTPNFIQILFSGLKIEGFKIVIKSKTIAINKDQIFKFSFLNNGYTEINKKIIENKIPKLYYFFYLHQYYYT